MAGGVWHSSVSVKAFAEKPHMWLGGLSRNGIPESSGENPEPEGILPHSWELRVLLSLHIPTLGPSILSSGSAPVGGVSWLLGLCSLTGAEPSVFEASKHELSCTADSYHPDCSCPQDAESQVPLSCLSQESCRPHFCGESCLKEKGNTRAAGGISSSPKVRHWKSAPQSLKRLCPLWYDNCLVCVTLPAEMGFPCVSAQGYGFL